jgi:hypothetical protein
MRFQSMLLYGLPWMSIAVMSMSFCQFDPIVGAGYRIDFIESLSWVSDHGTLQQGECYYDIVANEICFYPNNDEEVVAPGRTYSIEYTAT